MNHKKDVLFFSANDGKFEETWSFTHFEHENNGIVTQVWGFLHTPDV
jgi:hypothetical protein